jgi:hypothetical protein
VDFQQQLKNSLTLLVYQCTREKARIRAILPILINLQASLLIVQVQDSPKTKVIWKLQDPDTIKNLNNQMELKGTLDKLHQYLQLQQNE